MKPEILNLRNEVYLAFLKILDLREEHIGALKKRGFELKTIQQNGYKSIPRDENTRIKIAEKLYHIFGLSLFDVPGFYLANYNGSVMGPRMIGDHELLIPMRTKDRKINSLYLRKDNVTGPGKYTHFSCRILNDIELKSKPHSPIGEFSSDQLILTEGPIKGDLVGQYLNIDSLCLPGVGMWRQFSEVTDFTDYKLYDIAYDRDLETNLMVANSCSNLFKYLVHKNVNVRIAIWNNSFKGIDDAITAGQTISYLEKDDAKRYLEKVYADNDWAFIDWSNGDQLGNDYADNSWNDIRELPEIHYPAPFLDPQIIPEPIRDWAIDASNRMQSHVEFLLCALITLFSSMIGRSFNIRPKKFDNWKIIPNLWGLLIGLPSSKKSPCLSEARRFIEKIQSQLDEDYKNNLYTWQSFESSKQIELKTLDDNLKKLLKNKNANAAAIQNIVDEKTEILEELATMKPVHKRIYVNDVTIEIFQEILRDNPFGVANIRDELSGFLMNLEKTGRENDRSFYLECYNGSDPYNVARISRGSFKLFPCSSILGGIQPDTLKTILIDGMKSGANNDGFTQRFQLAVWPEFPAEFEYVDQVPNHKARDRVQKITDKIFGFRINQNVDAEASAHFDDEAQLLFQDWLTGIERRARSGKINPPSLAAHVLKYPKLMCSLALMFELIERFDSNLSIDEIFISYKNAKLATQWCEFLEAHALKIYSNAVSEELSAADSLSEKILSKDITDGMPAREIYRKGWKNLAKKELVYAGLEVLEDYGWARLETIESGGAPKKVIKINPKIYNREVLS